jgi:hypothetical protein
MPALKKPRHEAFAQAIFKGLFADNYPSHGRSYAAAGYTNKGVGQAGGAAETNASRLLKNAQIIERIQELQAEAAKHTKESAEKCVAELNHIKDEAMADSEKPAYSAAVSAVMGKAKILGLVTDKTEIRHGNADFDNATSVHDVGVKLLQAVGYAFPSDADVALALRCHEQMIEKLESIAERAGVGDDAVH